MGIKKLFAFDTEGYDNNIECSYSWAKYNKAIDYYNEMKQLPGVEEQHVLLQNLTNEYKRESEALIEDFRDIEKKYTTCHRAFNVRKINIIIFVASIILMMLLSQSTFGLILLLSFYLSMFTLPVTVGVYFVFRTIYRKRVSLFWDKSAEKNSRYRNACVEIYDNIDQIYLNSLDSTHRQLVLLQRQQQKQHEEMVRLQKENLKLQSKMNTGLDNLAYVQRQQSRVLDEINERDKERFKKQGY